MPKVSIIIVNYNGINLIIDCLKALEKQSFNDFEILIVDNGSSDHSIRGIDNFLSRSRLASISKIIPLNRNLGFTGGNGEGLKYAKGEYIALLNNDTEAENKWLEELVMSMDGDSGVGICASKIIVYGKNIIDSAGDGFSTLLKGFKRGEGEDVLSYNRKEYIFGACAGASLYRRKMIEEIGFLDADFFLIHEDTDLNLRANLYGWKVLYVPTAIVYHKVRSTIGNLSDASVYFTLRNMELVRIKNIPLTMFVRFLTAVIIGTLAEFIYFAIKHKKFILYFKAKFDTLRLLPQMLKKRAMIQRSKKTDESYIMNLMTHAWETNFMEKRIKKFLQE